MSLIYRGLVSSAEKFVPQSLRPLWEHPAGPKTIHFWAPLGKWALVIAGLADAARPAEKLSFNQSLALALTGTIWSRYALVIIPKNWSLFGVNMFVAATGFSQLYRIWQYRQGLDKNDPTGKTLVATNVSIPDSKGHGSTPGVLISSTNPPKDHLPSSHK
ncbi:hypothetical protein RvY_17292 [Ramazzottius varieornatus]|uniref:Mitochondrial pyruvate carrier n=1 Tax=Ramazzottius varieornatus TaxID=947166 RepID=A0A1D1W1M0_RAMVA|nr:hypothetical protein RvY_17292 [Ramazzottius varieornatus]